MVVTSIVRDRGHVSGIVVALAVSATLIAAPMAFGAGDQVASGKLSLKVTKGFKKALKRNRVHMGPKNFKIKSGPSRIDPTNGTGKLALKGKLKFRDHGKKVVASKLIAKIGINGGNVKGRVQGSNLTLFRLGSRAGGAKVDRVGFGAAISRVSARLGDHLAKKVNKTLGLHSLVTSRKVAQVKFDEQPKTVAITGGTALVDIPASYLPSALGGTDPNTVAAKQPAHCIDPADGVTAIAPGEIGTILHPNPNVPLPPLTAARLRFPVTGGTVSPAGNDGVIQLAGGVRLMSGKGAVGALEGGNCSSATPGPTTSPSILDTISLAPNLGLLNIQAQTVVGGTNPGCTFTGGGPTGCGVFSGDKGIAIGQVIDASAIAVSADPNAHTVAINGGVIKNNATATTVLNGLFPNGTSPLDPSKDFADGDKFGISSLSMTTR